MPAPRIRVGLLGAGPVTRAIHLPTLARLSELFDIVHVSDVDGVTASTIAGRVGARHSATAEELLGDADVDVVAVCSPTALHAVHVIAACQAGKKAVFCEKPLADTAADAAKVMAAAKVTGAPVIVGAMHAFDPCLAKGPDDVG